MEESGQETIIESVEHAGGFNYNKLHAVLCIAASSIVSVSLILWACKAFL